MDNPSLVAPGVKCFFNESLKQSYSYRKKYEYIFYNLLGLFIFIIILGGILYYKYKGKLTTIEKQMKSNKDRAYILEKIKAIPKKNTSMITNLPKWDE